LLVGKGTFTWLRNPSDVAVDASGNLLIAETGFHRIQRLAAGTGFITTVAGNGRHGFSGEGGPATSADLSFPYGVAVDGSSNVLIADTVNNRIRRVEAITGIIMTVAGDGARGFSGDEGPGTSARLNNPTGVAVDGGGNVFIADRENHRIRRVDAGTGIIKTVAGTGAAGFSGDGEPATSAALHFPYGVAVDAGGNLFIADRENHRIRLVEAGTGIIKTVAGSGGTGKDKGGFSGDGEAATSAVLNRPMGMAVDADGNLFIADSGNHRIRRVDAVTRIIKTVAGDGVRGFSGDGGLATIATLNGPSGVAIDSGGNLLILDRNNECIRKVNGPFT
jgi:hypothetical protein